jgi:hypothetical protein
MALFLSKKLTMKKLFPVLFCLLSLSLFAQQKPTDLDKSPLDVSYCPSNYPILKMNGKVKDEPVARVIYSRPQKLGREIFGNIVSYNQVWRLGANEATEIEFFRNVKINGKTIAKGRYTIYAVCTDTVWTLILNSEKDVWGLLYNSKKDVYRTTVHVQKNNQPVEIFTMFFEDMQGGTVLNILWDTIKVELPIKF